MRFILNFLYCLFISITALAQEFLPQTEDIPQAPSLNQIEEIANFDYPGERLVILTALSTKSTTEIEKYYQKALKNLGWQESKKNFYQRQNDSFQIEFSKQDKKTFIQFTLTQKNTP